MIQRKTIQKRMAPLTPNSDNLTAIKIVAKLFRRSSSILISAALATMISVSNVHALGLGNLEVQSNLEQPLDGFIELRVVEGEDLSLLNARIANEKEFEDLGIDYPSYLNDISLSLDTQGSRSLLRVSSGDVIISEPFIHILVKVDWSGGSFLREYTALIDPPAYASETPRAISAPSVVGTDQSYQPEAEPELDVEEIEPEQTYVDEVESIEEVFDVEPEDVAPFEVEQDFEAEAEADTEAEDFVEEGVDDSLEEQADDFFEEESDGFLEEEVDSDIAEIVDQGLDAESSADYTADYLPTDAQYGPVTSGESLSVIAAELQQQFPDLSIYQIMKVLFEENRSAFIRENINGLIQGVILNIGDLNAIRAVDVAESKAFFSQQLSEWDPSYLISSSSSDNDFDALSVGGDEYSFDDDLGSDTDSDYDLLTGSQDSFQVGASSSQDSLVSSAEGGSDSGEVLLLQQQIVELETSLGSSQLENQELSERISILEGQLADMNRLMELSVESADLANVEATLAQQNESSDQAFDTPEEISDVSETIASEFDEFDAEYNLEDAGVDPDGVGDGLDDGSYDELEEVTDNNDGIEGIVDDESDLAVVDSGDGVSVDDSASGDDAVSGDDGIEEVKDAEPVVSTTATTTPSSQPSGFMAKAKQALDDAGMVGIGAGLGGLILAALGLLIYRRRKADEEFEISMLSIGSVSQSIDDLATKSVSQLDVRTAAEGGGDRDTSFLTVYTDTDAVVQADEVDPVAEADVYIAYGRDEQAEEVLLDGISNYPSRVDIKHKLLTLYHKNTNIEGFERVAEETYAQRADLSTEAWEDISRMGKAISPDNPIFELSSEELAAANKVVNQVEENTVFVDDDEDSAAAAAAAATAAALAANSETTIDDDVAADDVAPMAAPTDDLVPINDGDESSSDLLLDDELAEIERAVAAAEVSVSESPFESGDEADELELVLPADDAEHEVAEEEVAEHEVTDERVAEPEVAEHEIAEDDDDLPFAEDSPSINLINFDDGRSEMSELDEVSIDSLSRADEATVHVDSMRDELTQSITDEIQAENNIDEPTSSGLELDPDYDEARTQFELAKVFVDLGDEDGARKILSEILTNEDNSEELMKDSQDLLDSIKA